MGQDENLPSVSNSTISRLLRDIGFKYETIKRNSIFLDQPHIAEWRAKYLLSVKKCREEGREFFYLDETWVNAGHFVTKSYTDTTIKCRRDTHKSGLTTGLRQPKSKGARLIILNIGSHRGFLENSSLVFRSKKATGDYHDEMNGEHFKDWFSEMLPKIPKGKFRNKNKVFNNGPYLTFLQFRTRTQGTSRITCRKPKISKSKFCMMSEQAEIENFGPLREA